MKNLILLLLFIGGNCQQDPVELQDRDPKPDRCIRPAEFLNKQCCVFPPFFTRTVAYSCGAIFKLTFEDPEHNITAFRRTPTTGCQHWKCVLKQYALLNDDDDDAVSEEKYYKHLDKWSALNPSFTDVMTKAKKICNLSFRIFMPLKTCDFYNLHNCIRHFVKLQCPVLFPIKECHEQKLFYKDCKRYYY